MPSTSPEQFEKYLSEPESVRIEFKEAKNRYDFEKLKEYCVALANEGGGIMILGVTDKRPRQIVGTTAFEEPGRTEAGLHENLGHRIPVEEFHYQGKRILLIHIPSRLPGCAWNLKGRYLKRAGDELTSLNDHELKQIFAETGPDFTAELVPHASFQDLQPEAVLEFLKLWHKKNPSLTIISRDPEQALADAELTLDGAITYAALILMGRPASIGRFLAQTEVIFEYRSSEAAGPAADREEYREPFLLFHDRLWHKINLRNDRQSFQQDFFRYDIPTFDETSIREALLNAICHRDYRAGGSVFIRQYSRRLEVVSPGGFPPGITQENIADQQNPRNRRLAEALNRCGFIERSGHGINLMIEQAVRQHQTAPGFFKILHSRSFPHPCGNRSESRIPSIHRALGRSRAFRFPDARFPRLGYPFPGAVSHRTHEIAIAGAHRRGSGGIPRPGTRLPLFSFPRALSGNGQSGELHPKKGLDHETNKALVVKHLTNCGFTGAPISDLEQVLPAQSRTNIRRMHTELRDENKVKLVGSKSSSRWLIHPDPPDEPANL